MFYNLSEIANVNARVAKLVDAPALGAGACKSVEVRVLSPAPSLKRLHTFPLSAPNAEVRVRNSAVPPCQSPGTKFKIYRVLIIFAQTQY